MTRKEQFILAAGILEGIGRFCRQYNLSYNAIWRIINKKQKSHKGWHLND